MSTLPLRPETFACASISLDLEDDVLKSLCSFFVNERLTSCSSERFHLSYEQYASEGLSEIDALAKACLDAVLNEKIVECIGLAIEREIELGRIDEKKSRIAR